MASQPTEPLDLKGDHEFFTRSFAKLAADSTPKGRRAIVKSMTQIDAVTTLAKEQDIQKVADNLLGTAQTAAGIYSLQQAGYLKDDYFDAQGIAAIVKIVELTSLLKKVPHEIVAEDPAVIDAQVIDRSLRKSLAGADQAANDYRRDSSIGLMSSESIHGLKIAQEKIIDAVRQIHELTGETSELAHFAKERPELDEGIGKLRQFAAQASAELGIDHSGPRL